MSYLERLKILKGAPTHPTKPTEPPETVQKVGFVGFVGYPSPHIQNSHPAAGQVDEVVGNPQTQASNDPEPPTAKPTPPAPAPADPPAKPMTKAERFGAWVESWRPLAHAYHAHHFKCPVCIAAGKGYGLRCGTGVGLWTAYSETPPAPDAAPRHKGDRHD